jgi:hypothetical protein
MFVIIPLPAFLIFLCTQQVNIHYPNTLPLYSYVPPYKIWHNVFVILWPGLSRVALMRVVKEYYIFRAT